MRTASHSYFSPFVKCSSFNSSMLTTLESITLIRGPPRLRLSPLRCPQKRGRHSALQAAALRDATPPRAVHAGAGRHGAAALGLGAALRRSSIDLSENDVLRSDDRNHVGDHVPARHLIHCGEMRKTR